MIDSLLISNNINPIIYSITGSLLGDGHIRFTHKKEGKPTGNALMAFTFKSHDYINYLWSTIYKAIVTSNPPLNLDLILKQESLSNNILLTPDHYLF